MKKSKLLEKIRIEYADYGKWTADLISNRFYLYLDRKDAHVNWHSGAEPSLEYVRPKIEKHLSSIR